MTSPCGASEAASKGERLDSPSIAAGLVFGRQDLAGKRRFQKSEVRRQKSEKDRPGRGDRDGLAGLTSDFCLLSSGF